MITRERCSRVAAGALCALALGALLAVCGAEEQPKLGPHEVLIRVIRINNGTVDAEVRDVPGKGRGLVAFRPMKKNTIAVRLPRTMAFQLAPVTKALEESAELLLEPKHENTAPWFQIYWDSLPARDEFLWRRQPFPTDKLALLQDEALASNLTKALDYTRKYFKQAMTVKGTFEDFAEATALARPHPPRARQVNAYAFQFHDDQATHVVRTMLPLIDLANHAEAGAPQRPPRREKASSLASCAHPAGLPSEATMALIQASDMDFYAYATRDLEPGEELTLPYGRPAGRPDHALFHYGFLPGGAGAAGAPPPLAALDLPGGGLHDTPTFSEEDHLPLGRLQTHAELDRLHALLAAFPTTEAEDAELLGAEQGLESPLEGLFVEYRLQRKRALGAAAARLAAALEEDAALAELENLEALEELETLEAEEGGAGGATPGPDGEDAGAEPSDEL